MTNKRLLPPALPQTLKHSINCSEGKGHMYDPSDTTKALIVTGMNGDVRYETDGERFRLYASSTGTAVLLEPVDPVLDAMVRNAPWRPVTRPRGRLRVARDRTDPHLARTALHDLRGRAGRIPYEAEA